MTEAEKERAAIVAWLATTDFKTPKIWHRLKYAYFVLTNPRGILHGTAVKMATHIQSGDHHKEQEG